MIRLRWDILSIVWSAVSIHTHSRSIFNKRIKIRNETYMFHGSFILNQLVQQAFKNNYHIIKFFSCNYTDLSRILRSIWPTNLSKLDLENTLQKKKTSTTMLDIFLTRWLKPFPTLPFPWYPATIQWPRRLLAWNYQNQKSKVSSKCWPSVVFLPWTCTLCFVETM